MLERIIKDLEVAYTDNETRLTHVKGVVTTSLELAKLYGVDQEKARLAAYLHDITKYEDIDFHRHYILKYFGPHILEEFSEPLYHAFSARAIAQERYGIEDEDILMAIESHTVGRANMSMLEKIIFIADYIEPSRTYPSCVKVRPIAYKDIDQAVYQAVYHSINLFERMKGSIPKRAYETLHYYKNKGETHE